MNQVIVFLWVAVFSASAPDGAGVQSMSTPHEDMGSCEKHEAFVWAQTAETYAESDILFMFTECLRIIPRPVPPVIEQRPHA